MIKIGVLQTTSGEAQDYYRMTYPLGVLGRMYRDQIQVIPLTGTISNSTLAVLDILMVDRPMNRQHATMLKVAKLCGCKIWLDYDDDIMNVMPGNPAFGTFMQEEVRAAIPRSLSYADAISVTTKTLAEVIAPHTAAPIMIVPNAWNDVDNPFKEIRPTGDPFKIMWRGSATHQEDLRSIEKAVKRFINDKEIDVAFIGDMPSFTSGMDGQIFFVPPKGLHYYFQNLYDLAPDALLAPLLPNRFNQCKSNIAWIEATIAGAVCFAPDSLDEWQQPGIINYRNPDDLINKVGELMNNPGMKIDYVEESRATLEDYYRLTEINKRRILIIEELCKTKIHTSLEETTGAAQPLRAAL